MLFQILRDHILPIFLVVGIGAVFWRIFRPDTRSLSRIAFYILSPCLVFSSLTGNQIPASEFWQLAGFAITTILAGGALAWIAGRLLRLPRSMIAALMLTCMFVNGGNYGISLNLFAFGEHAMARAVVYWIVSTVGLYSLGIFIASSGSVGTTRALKSIFKVPPIYALALAGILDWQGWVTPAWVQQPVDLLGRAAIPVLLLILGMQIAQSPRSLNWRWVGLASLVRMVLMPLVALGIANIFHLTGTAKQVGIIEASMPTAVIVTVLALEYKLEPRLVTEAVIFSTLVSPLTLTPIIAFLQI